MRINEEKGEGKEEEQKNTPTMTPMTLKLKTERTTPERTTYNDTAQDHRAYRGWPSRQLDP